MKIFSNTGGMAQTNAYLLIDDATAAAAIIDAPQDTTAALIEDARRHNATVTHLLLTHGHWDHISDHQVVTNAFPNARVLIPEIEEPRLLKPTGMNWPLPYEIPPRKADAYLVEGQNVHIGNIALQVIATPGHAAGHVCLYAPASGAQPPVLFAGDLLMAGSVGRYDFADGDLETLKASLRKVLLLPDNTLVLSGHGPETTIGNEKNGNPFIRSWNLH